MIILSKDSEQVINMDNVTNLYIKSGRVCASYTNGTGSQVGQYDSDSEAKVAMKILIQELKHNDVVQAPLDMDVKAWMASNSESKSQVHHYIDGKKTRGHGGS